jgi:hypothetical protein
LPFVFRHFFCSCLHDREHAFTDAGDHEGVPPPRDSHVALHGDAAPVGAASRCASMRTPARTGRSRNRDEAMQALSLAV